MSESLPSVEADPYEWPFDKNWTSRNTALLSIDYQYDYFDPRGYLASKNIELTNAAFAIAQAAETIGWAREIGIPVVHTRQVYHPLGQNLSKQRKAWSLKTSWVVGDEGPLGKFLIAGQEGSDLLSSLAPIGDEALVDRAAINPFINSDLHNLLSKMGIRNLIVQGGIIEGSTHTAVCAANDRGYEVMLLADCCATLDSEYAETVKRATVLGGGLFGVVSDFATLAKATSALT
ncbi:MAG: isochorismatase family cysteine hydrolase [Verrucomicrobiota bacterium]